MADSFQQRISLEGAEDIIKQLQLIGSEATKAIGQLKTSVTQANPALQALSQTSLAAQNALKGLGTAVSQVTQVITPFSASLGSLFTTFGAFAGPAGILAAVGGLGLFVKNAADSVITMDRQANALGLSIQQFKALSNVAKAAGLSQEEVATSLTRVAQQVAAQAQEQLKGIGDLAKQIVSGDIPGLGAGQSILSKIIKVEDVQRLRGIIQSIKPDLDAFLKAAGIPQASTQSVQQFTESILNLAKGTGPVAEGLRKILSVAANANTAVTPFEKIDEALAKTDPSLKSLRTSFLDGKAGALDLFNSLLKISDEISKVAAGPGLTALEAKLGGRGIGPELLTALKNARGEGGLLSKELEKIGIPQEAVNQARALRAAFNELDSAAKNAQNSLLLAFGPTLASGLRSTAADIDNIKKLLDGKFEFKLTNPFAAGPGSIFGNGSAIKEFFIGTIGGAVNSAIDSVVQAFAALPEKIAGALSGVDFSAIFSGIGATVNSAIDTIVQRFAALPGQIAGALGGLADILAAPFVQAVQVIVGLWDTVINKIREVLGLGQSAQGAAADASGGGGGGGGGGGFAGGGPVWGAGSTTSDSILARLSRGEFVIRAAAVSHYGPGLLAALNAMRLPRLPGFSLGGLADGLGRTLRANLAIPGFAAGGLANLAPAPARAANVPITLDLRTDRGRFRGQAMADRDVAEALTRFAVIDQIASMGKKSGAY